MFVRLMRNIVYFSIDQYNDIFNFLKEWT